MTPEERLLALIYERALVPSVIKFAAVFGALAAFGWGQVPQPTPQPLPTNVLMFGAGYGGGTTVWGSYARLVDSGQGIYASMTHDYMLREGVPMPSTRGGAYKVLFRYRETFLLGLMTAGIAQTSTATLGAFSGGGLVAHRFRRGWLAEVVVRQIAAGGSNRLVVEVGTGLTW